MLFALGASKGTVTESQKPRKKKRATKASLKSLLSEINDPSSAEEASQLLDIYYYDKAMHKEASRASACPMNMEEQKALASQCRYIST